MPVTQHQLALTDKELFTIKCALSKQVRFYTEIAEKTGFPIKEGTHVDAMVKTSTFLLDTLPNAF